MMCEAFCLYRDRDIYHPYEKHHSTALEAGRLAQELGVRNLVLYHTEEDTGKDRKELYSQEVSQVFNGTVHVPSDLKIIKL
ncbi:MAG: hypothetical protein K6A82_09460 [Prevotella sp.]|nr:hypothetical protein [Prevotella sp.]